MVDRARVARRRVPPRAPAVVGRRAPAQGTGVRGPPPDARGPEHELRAILAAPPGGRVRSVHGSRARRPDRSRCGGGRPAAVGLERGLAW